MASNDSDDRYQYMGLEMIPTPRYDAKTDEPCTGTAWMWRVENGVIALEFNNDKVLTGTSYGFEDYKDWDRGDDLQDVILSAAVDGLSIPEALERVRKAFGNPTVIIALKDINESADELGPTAQQLVRPNE
ncbi:hypothetical protein [Corynebacterium sp. NML130628]|uniref:hypothetical protein n=1 Tax=Corynebacterium sp. NML130628 TaxID=1906333 RepID=UPI0008FB3B4A|nr:hypothetical protein [Corynebacterium sp. NML130628]OIR42795.1 hypothetical protein BJP07_07760 [Corynebacterium sp. NML130628]